MRVLAVTGNASLVVALGSMMRDWEVVTARNADEAMDSVQGAVVALVDLSDTSSGLEVADQLYRSGVTIPSVIIGDTIAEHPRASVLVRPFSLEDLGAAVKAAAERGPGPAAAASRPVAPPKAEEPLPPMTAPAAERASGPTGSPAVAAAPTPAPEPEPQPTPGRRGGLSVVRPEPEPIETEMEETVEEAAEEPAATEPEPASDAPAASTADVMRSQLEELPPPPPPVVEPTAAPEDPLPAAPAARLEMPFSEPEAPQGARWRRKRRASQPAAQAPDENESPLVRRLEAAAGWSREIEQLLAELPVLEDLSEMADALAGEIETQFAAQTAAVFALGEGGYHPVAHRGLSRVEAGMVVPDTQPLFSDVIRTQEGILIQPVDLAQGLVAGIGGARTEAMMAAPVISEGACIAVVVVGGDRFAETDLDRLSDLATEAAPGIAVARLLQRLGGRSRA